MSVGILEVPNDKSLYCRGIYLNGSGTALSAYIGIGYTTNIAGAISGTTIGLFRNIGGTATLSVDGVSMPSLAATPITFSELVPVPPFNTTYFPIWVQDNGANIAGTVKIDTNGQVTIYSGFSSNFTGGMVVDGFYSFSVTYCTYT